MLDINVISSTYPDGGPEPPKLGVQVLESSDKYGKVAVEPLQRGFARTIGNPLRRILMSSTNGSAITWVKIDDVVHEYAAIPGVKEEVMDLLLNVKRIRIRSRSERTGKMRLDVSGPGRVCAGDIITSVDFQVVNPELHLATLDSDDSRLSIEFNVEQGVGYQQAKQGEGSESMPVGVLPVDAIFSPVRKVNFEVEHTRVGQVTDYERLVLEVWTDGTVSPVEAVRRAANSLVNHYFLFSNLDESVETRMDRASLMVSPEIYQTPIEKLELSPRTLNCLKRAHITKLGEVLERSDDELLKIRNFGFKSLTELKDKLVEHGIAPNASDEFPTATINRDVLEPGALPTGVTLSPEELGELIASGGIGSPASSQAQSGEGSWSVPDNDELDEDEDDDADDYDDEEEGSF